LRNRAAVLKDLRALPSATIASSAEAFEFLEGRRLWGQGLGWIDLHLLASATLTPCGLWIDKRLAQAARGVGLSRIT